jgi:hypothetical protein
MDEDAQRQVAEIKARFQESGYLLHVHPFASEPPTYAAAALSLSQRGGTAPWCVRDTPLEAAEAMLTAFVAQGRIAAE